MILIRIQTLFTLIMVILPVCTISSFFSILYVVLIIL